MSRLTIESLSDFSGTLEELNEIITELIAEHGKKSIIYFDAGYNNVDVILERL